MSIGGERSWSTTFSKEPEIKNSVALQRLATSVFTHWKTAFNAEKYPDMVGLGQIHDIWNMMYRDMQAIYTLEQVVGVEYHTEMIEEAEEGEE